MKRKKRILRIKTEDYDINYPIEEFKEKAARDFDFELISAEWKTPHPSRYRGSFVVEFLALGLPSRRRHRRRSHRRSRRGAGGTGIPCHARRVLRLVRTQPSIRTQPSATTGRERRSASRRWPKASVTRGVWRRSACYRAAFVPQAEYNLNNESKL